MVFNGKRKKRLCNYIIRVHRINIIKAQYIIKSEINLYYDKLIQRKNKKIE